MWLGDKNFFPLKSIRKNRLVSTRIDIWCVRCKKVKRSKNYVVIGVRLRTSDYNNPTACLPFYRSFSDPRFMFICLVHTQSWWTRKKSEFRRFRKMFKIKACKSWGMRRSYPTPQWRRMQRNADIGLFTRPSSLESAIKAGQLIWPANSAMVFRSDRGN